MAFWNVTCLSWHPAFRLYMQWQGSVLVLPASTDNASLRQNRRTAVTKLRLSTEDHREDPQRWLFTTLPRHRWNDENQSIACKEKEIILDFPPCAFGLKPLIRLIHMLEPTLRRCAHDNLYLRKTTMFIKIFFTFFSLYGQDAHFRHMNTLLLDLAQSFVHLAHPTSSYPGTSAWVLNLNHKVWQLEKCFHIFPFKPSAHILLDAFEETLPPSQAREFGHRQALLMLCRWSIMPQSQSLRKSYKVGLRHSYWPQVQVKKCNYKVLLLHNFFLPSSPATSRWQWHCRFVLHPGTVRSAGPRCDLRWSFPWCSSRRPSPDRTLCIQCHHFGCSLRKNDRSPCRGPWTPDTSSNEGNEGGSWWIWIWHCVAWSAKELRMPKISMLRSQWHSSGSLWPHLPWKERIIQNSLCMFWQYLWDVLASLGFNMLDKHDEVLQSWSSKAPAVGPELRGTCLIELAVTSVAGTRFPNTDKHAETATCVLKQQYPTHLCLTEALIVTSPLETSIPAANEFTTTNSVAWSLAPSLATIRKELAALQSWMWKVPPSITQAANTLITSEPWERKEVGAAPFHLTIFERLHMPRKIKYTLSQTRKSYCMLFILHRAFEFCLQMSNTLDRLWSLDSWCQWLQRRHWQNCRRSSCLRQSVPSVSPVVP